MNVHLCHVNYILKIFTAETLVCSPSINFYVSPHMTASAGSVWENCMWQFDCLNVYATCIVLCEPEKLLNLYLYKWIYMYSDN